MKKSIFYAFILAASVWAAGCGKAKQPLELVTDQYGVAYKVNPSEKNVYLVFTGHYSTDDDGHFENFDGADDVLKIMAEHDVKGSFFPTGNCFRVDRYQQVIKDIISQGHYLSAHSDKHLLLCSYGDRSEDYVTEDSLTRDIQGMEAELEKFGLTKDQYYWMIPPYEHYNQFSADILRKLGYHLVNPTQGLVTVMDWMGPEHPQYHSAQKLIDNIWKYEAENTLDGAVILVHAMDYPNRTDDDRLYTHLGEIIEKLKEKGYGFKTFKDVIAAEK